MPTPSVRRRSVYMRTEASRKQHGKRALYLVERIENGQVFAKFTPLGYVNNDAAEAEARIALQHHKMTTSSQWEACRSHQRANVILGTNYEEVD